MVKTTTRTIQEQIVLIGSQLGFQAFREYSFTNMPGMYAPRYDVVWLLSVSELNVENVADIPLINGKYIPFAAFEIEGSTTSSKNQLGNIGNLKLSPCYFNFLVVNNAAVANENDTYRRAIKIVRTIQKVMGERPLFLFDACMLEDLPAFSKTLISGKSDEKLRLKGSGGEKDSIIVAKSLINKLQKSNLQIEYDRTPDYFKWAFHLEKDFMSSKYFTLDPNTFEQKLLKQDGQYFYKPKIDIALGFQISEGFTDFLREIAVRLKSDACDSFSAFKISAR